MNTKTKDVKGLQLLLLNLTKGKDKSIKEQEEKINYPADTERTINIKDIIVLREFQDTKPSPKKLIEYTSRFEQNGMIDTAITVKKSIGEENITEYLEE